MKRKDITKVMSMISDWLNDHYGQNSEWSLREKDMRRIKEMPVWDCYAGVFKLRLFYWTHRESNKGTWLVRPTENRSATIVLEYKNGETGHDVLREVDFSFDEDMLYVHTSLRVDGSFLANYISQQDTEFIDSLHLQSRQHLMEYGSSDLKYHLLESQCRFPI